MTGKPIILSNGEDDGYEFVVCDECREDVGSNWHTYHGRDLCDRCYQVEIEEKDMDLEDEEDWITLEEIN